MVRTVLVFSLVADEVWNFLQNQRFEHRQQIKQNQQVIFIKLRSTPECDLMLPMEANLLIVIVRTVRSIDHQKWENIFIFEVIAKFQKAQDFFSEAEDKKEALLCQIR